MKKVLFSFVVGFLLAVSNISFAGEPAILKKVGITTEQAVEDFQRASVSLNGKIEGTQTKFSSITKFAKGLYTADMVANPEGREIHVRIIVTTSSAKWTFGSVLGTNAQIEQKLPVSIGQVLEKNGYIWVSKKPDEVKPAEQAPVREGSSAQPTPPQTSSP